MIRSHEYFDVFDSHKELVLELYARMNCKDVHRELRRLGHASSYNFLVRYLKDIGVLRKLSTKIPGTFRKPYRHQPQTCELCFAQYSPTNSKQRFCPTCISNGQTRICIVARSYGITYHQYKDLLRSQHGSCAICQTDLGTLAPKSVHIDHDHVTDDVRGILCSRCNQALGLFKDSPQIMRRAAAYIEDHEKEKERTRETSSRT